MPSHILVAGLASGIVIDLFDGTRLHWCLLWSSFCVGYWLLEVYLFPERKCSDVEFLKIAAAILATTWAGNIIIEIAGTGDGIDQSVVGVLLVTLCYEMYGDPDEKRDRSKPDHREVTIPIATHITTMYWTASLVDLAVGECGLVERAIVGYFAYPAVMFSMMHLFVSLWAGGFYLGGEFFTTLQYLRALTCIFGLFGVASICPASSTLFCLLE